MSRSLPSRTVKRITKLYDKGLLASEIARKTGVSYSAVYGHTIIPNTIISFRRFHPFR